jgi:hypothetical protein
MSTVQRCVLQHDTGLTLLYSELFVFRARIDIDAARVYDITSLTQQLL